jgi:hypothetical protein
MFIGMWIPGSGLRILPIIRHNVALPVDRDFVRIVDKPMAFLIASSTLLPVP